MVEHECVRLEVALACGEDTISGTLDDHCGDAVEFSGWLELLSAFETICGRVTGRAGAAPRPGPRPRPRDSL